MATLTRSVGSLTLLCLVAAVPAAAQHGHEPRTKAAVIAADEAWGLAEVKGDGAYVAGLLRPTYQSVGSKGKATPGANIVAGATSRGNDPAFAAKVAAWKASHPSHAEVTIDGDTAVLTWVISLPSGETAVSSCDIFVYRNGHWRALYSQHTASSE